MPHWFEWFKRSQKQGREPSATEVFRKKILDDALAGRNENAGIALLNAQYPGLAHPFLKACDHYRDSEARESMKGLTQITPILESELDRSTESQSFEKLVRHHIKIGNIETAKRIANERGIGADLAEHLAWAEKLISIAENRAGP